MVFCTKMQSRFNRSRRRTYQIFRLDNPPLSLNNWNFLPVRSWKVAPCLPVGRPFLLVQLHAGFQIKWFCEFSGIRRCSILSNRCIFIWYPHFADRVLIQLITVNDDLQTLHTLTNQILVAHARLYTPSFILFYLVPDYCRRFSGEGSGFGRFANPAWRPPAAPRDLGAICQPGYYVQ